MHRSLWATKELRAGCVWVNDHIPIIGRNAADMSSYSFDEYTQIKHVMYDRTAVAEKPWHRTIFNSG